MTQTSNRFFDEIGRLMNDAAGAAQGVKREVDAVVRNQAERIPVSYTHLTLPTNREV